MKKSLRITAIILFPIIICIAIYLGVLEDTVEILSFEIGQIEKTDEIGQIEKTDAFKLDYTMFVTLRAKGALIAGRKISVFIELIPQNKKSLEILKNSRLMVVFSGSTPYPTKRTYDQIVNGTCELKFDKDDKAGGSTEIIYYNPEMYTIGPHSAYEPDKSHGKYSYLLLINDEKPASFQRQSPFLFIAPLETRLQLKQNNIALIISVIALYLALYSFIREIRKNSDK